MAARGGRTGGGAGRAGLTGLVEPAAGAAGARGPERDLAQGQWETDATVEENAAGGFVFIDEPFAHLDVRNIQLVGHFLKRGWRRAAASRRPIPTCSAKSRRPWRNWRKTLRCGTRHWPRAWPWCRRSPRNDSGAQGLRRDFALKARDSTKSIGAADWRWLESSFDLERLRITERQAQELPAGELLLWLPGRPSTAWMEAIAHLLRLAPAPSRISADADPAGVYIACTVGALWEAQGPTLRWAWGCPHPNPLPEGEGVKL